MVASATPAAPALLRNCPRSRDRDVESSLTVSPSVVPAPRLYNADKVSVKIVANLVAVIATGCRFART